MQRFIVWTRFNPLNDLRQVCGQIEVVRPLFESLQLSDCRIAMLFTGREHITLSTQLSGDSCVTPTSTKQSVGDVNSVGLMCEADSLEVTREWVNPVNPTETCVLLKVPAEVSLVIPL